MPSGKIDLEFKSLQINVSYHEQPEEKGDNEYPGCAHSFEIEEIESEGLDLLDFFEQLDLIDELTEEIYTKLN